MSQNYFLTGDWALRKAAKEEEVSVMGTIGILDRLYDGAYIGREEYLECLKRLQHYNGGKVRLQRKNWRGELGIQIEYKF